MGDIKKEIEDVLDGYLDTSSKAAASSELSKLFEDHLNTKPLKAEFVTNPEKEG